MCICAPNDMYGNVRGTGSHATNKTWKRPKYPSGQEWTRELCIHVTEDYRSKRHITGWVGLRNSVEWKSHKGMCVVWFSCMHKQAKQQYIYMCLEIHLGWNHKGEMRMKIQNEECEVWAGGYVWRDRTEEGVGKGALGPKGFFLNLSGGLVHWLYHYIYIFFLQIFLCIYSVVHSNSLTRAGGAAQRTSGLLGNRSVSVKVSPAELGDQTNREYAEGLSWHHPPWFHPWREI